MQSAVILQELIIQNFRNVSEANFSFGPALNLIVGDNGQGKTNCLEAIALACSLRPMQSLQNAELVQMGQARSKLLAKYFDAEVCIEITPQGKRASIDNKPIRSHAKLHERSPLVSFIPMELLMISGTASLRRRALDLASCSFFFEHYESLKAYEKILHHRNRLLKSWPLDREMLESFSHLLIKEGSSIMFKRYQALRLLNPHFLQSISDILGPMFSGSLNYISEKEDKSSYTEGDLIGWLKEQKEKSRSLEHIRKVTMFGPHLDDLAFILNSINAKNYASRGQMRALVLAFKLAHMMAVYSLRGNAPVVILDDIVSELDLKRKHNLLSVIKNLGVQAFLSANDTADFAGDLNEHQIFSIKGGEIT